MQARNDEFKTDPGVGVFSYKIPVFNPATKKPGTTTDEKITPLEYAEAVMILADQHFAVSNWNNGASDHALGKFVSSNGDKFAFQNVMHPNAPISVATLATWGIKPPSSDQAKKALATVGAPYAGWLENHDSVLVALTSGIKALEAQLASLGDPVPDKNQQLASEIIAKRDQLNIFIHGNKEDVKLKEPYADRLKEFYGIPATARNRIEQVGIRLKQEVDAGRDAIILQEVPSPTSSQNEFKAFTRGMGAHQIAMLVQSFYPHDNGPDSKYGGAVLVRDNVTVIPAPVQLEDGNPHLNGHQDADKLITLLGIPDGEEQRKNDIRALVDATTKTNYEKPPCYPRASICVLKVPDKDPILVLNLHTDFGKLKETNNLIKAAVKAGVVFAGDSNIQSLEDAKIITANTADPNTKAPDQLPNYLREELVKTKSALEALPAEDKQRGVLTRKIDLIEIHLTMIDLGIPKIYSGNTADFAGGPGVTKIEDAGFAPTGQKLVLFTPPEQPNKKEMPPHTQTCEEMREGVKKMKEEAAAASAEKLEEGKGAHL